MHYALMIVLLMLTIAVVQRHALNCSKPPKPVKIEIAERVADIRTANAAADKARANLDVTIANDISTPQNIIDSEDRFKVELYKVSIANDNLDAVKRKHAEAIERVVEKYGNAEHVVDVSAAIYERAKLVSANPQLSLADIKTLRVAYNNKRADEDNIKARRDTFLFERRVAESVIANRIEIAIKSMEDLIHQGAPDHQIQDAKDEITAIKHSIIHGTK
jgi:hypothetical protein